MARIQGLEEHEAPFLVRPIYWACKRMFGKVVTPVKVQARRPAIAWVSNLLGLAIEKSGLVDQRVHIAVQLRAAQMVGCPF